MWFRMSYNLLYSNLFADITTAKGKGDRPECRLSLLIQMLCASADGATFESAEHVSKRFGVNIVNSLIVWNSCLKHKALVQTPDGSFTMYNWMSDMGIVGKTDKKKRVSTEARAGQQGYSNEQVPAQVLDRLKKAQGNGR